MKKILAFSSIIFLLGSCKKNDTTSTNTCTLSNSTILGTYKLTKATKISITAGNVTETDATTDITSCRLDDTYEFKTGGTFQWVDAGTHCPASVLTNSESWSLSGTSITKELQGLLPNPWYYVVMDDFSVQQFTCTSLVLEKKVTQTSGGVTFQTGVRYYMTKQ